MQHRSLLHPLSLGLVLGLGLLVACDAEAPPTPFLELLPDRTAATEVFVEGSTEPSTTVSVSRDPAFEDGEEAPADVQSDPLTGRFRLRVPLALGATNTLEVTATDAVDNVSDPAVVVIEQIPVVADRVSVSLDDTVIDADDGTLRVVVQVANADAAADIEGLELDLSIEDYALDIDPVTVSVNAAGVAEGAIEGLTAAGDGILRVRARLAVGDDDPAEASRSFTVVPGRAATATLLLAQGGGTPSEDLSVTAGQNVDVSLSVEDAAGNAVEAPAFELLTDAPGALIAATRISGLTVAGAYEVLASIEGGALLATANLTVTAEVPARVEVVLSPSTVRAGEDVAVVATAYDMYGNVASETPSVSEDVPVYHAGLADEDAQDLLDVASSPGILAGRLTPFTAGTYTVSASLTGGESAAASLVVDAGDPVTFDLALDAAGPYAAGDVIGFTTEGLDAYGNTTPSQPVVTIDAPSATVALDAFGQGEVLGLVQAGTYTLTARLPGGTLSDAEAIVVDPAPGQGFNLTLSGALTVEGSRVIIFVRDAFGNPIDIALVDISIDGTPVASHPTVVQAGNELTFNAPGTFSVTATLAADASITDTELIAVQGVLDTLPPTATLAVTFPTGLEVGLGGFIETTTTFTDNISLAEAEVFAQFGQVPTCTSSSGVLVLAGLTNQQVTSTLQVPNCAAPLDAVTIVARIVDQAGNVGYSAVNTALTVAGLPGFDVSAGTPFVSTVEAFADRIKKNDGPTDVVAQGQAGVMYISMSNNDRIVVTFPDRSQADLRDIFDNRVNVKVPEGLARSPNGELFIGSNQDQEIALYDSSLLQQNGWITYGNAPGRLTYDFTGAAPMLCVARPAVGNITCYRNAATTPQVAGTLTGLTAPPAGSLRDSRMWYVDAGCDVAYADVTYDLTDPANPLINFNTPVPVVTLGGNCPDIVALPSGAAAVVDNTAGQLVHVLPDGTTTVMADGLPNPVGVDYDDNAVFLLDRNFQTVFRITGPL